MWHLRATGVVDFFNRCVDFVHNTCGPDAVPDAVPYTVPDAVPNAVPDAVPYAVPDTVPGTILGGCVELTLLALRALS